MKYALRPLLAVSVATILSLGPAFAQSDHPLISRYPGSKLSRHEGTDFAEASNSHDGGRTRNRRVVLVVR